MLRSLISNLSPRPARRLRKLPKDYKRPQDRTMTDLARRRLDSQQDAAAAVPARLPPIAPSSRPSTRERRMIRHLTRMPTDELHLHFTFVVDEIRRRHRDQGAEWHARWVEATKANQRFKESEARRPAGGSPRGSEARRRTPGPPIPGG